jgi:hypothetical protein
MTQGLAAPSDRVAGRVSRPADQGHEEARRLRRDGGRPLCAPEDDMAREPRSKVPSQGEATVLLLSAAGLTWLAKRMKRRGSRTTHTATPRAVRQSRVRSTIRQVTPSRRAQPRR